MCLIFIGMVSSAPPDDPSSCNCNNETILIQELQANNITLTEQVEFYKNLSDFYIALYESKEINVTNRELIALTQYISVLNQNINNLEANITDIKKELSFFKLSLKLSVSIFSFTLLGSFIALKLYFRRKKKQNEQATHSQGS